MASNQFQVSRVDRIIGKIAPEYGIRRVAAKLALHQFGYDAANFTRERNNAPQNINPNDFIQQRDRIQLMREAIDLEKNFAPAKVLNRKYAMYVAPERYYAQTGDSGLDRDVEMFLNEEAFPKVDSTNRFDFFHMLQLAVMGASTGGDYGFVPVRIGLQPDMSEEEILQLPLKIQAVEPDRLGGLYQLIVSDRYVAGITLDDYGAPLSYRVFKRGLVVGTYVDPVEIPAGQFFHYMDPQRIDTYRAVSRFDTAILDARDYYEMKSYLKAKAKLASALTVFTNSNGAKVGPGGMDPYGAHTLAGVAQLQQDIKHGQINHLPQGQQIEFPETASPGGETQYLMTKMLQFCAMSFNLPPSFSLDPSELGGVSVRLESEQARAEFKRGQKIITPIAGELKNVLLLDAVGKGRFPEKVLIGRKIFRGRFGYLAHPTPDIKNESDAEVNKYQNGLLNPMTYWSQEEGDPEAVANDMSRWTRIKKEAAARYENTPEEVFGNGPIAPGTQANQSKVDQAKPAAPKPAPPAP